MKKLVREYNLTQEERSEVAALARALSLTETTAAILYARGLRNEESMRAFLHPSRERFLSPMLMSGMREAKELIERARDEGWNVAVYGDYDADGIGACAILSRALKEFGIEPYLYIPERSEGYGLGIAAIDKIFDEFLPDLFITVDCGISNAREVEYIKEQGAYVIVTDHHELPERIPDCVCINPKFRDDYPYDNLCGAGVAFKLATALIGERAYSLLDFCALSTIADSVPLLGENRDIVYEGLKLMERSPRPALAALLGKEGEITAQTLAFTVAPRVNAAGRMGDAQLALRLFTTEDEEEISALAARLNEYNAERQKLCDELYEAARSQIVREGAYGAVITTVGEGWHPGLIGIVAARIAEEFSRPALLFVKRGDLLRGSARSIENVNIFEALRACSEYIEEFGGHAQAAGVNVREENFPKLRAALDRYLSEHYAGEDFRPALCIAEEIKGPFPQRLARELSLLEPFGMGNRRPLFAVKAGKLNAYPIKPLSPHVTLSCGGLDFIYFGGGRELRLLRSDIEKTLVFECNLSKFRGREYLKGYVRAVVYDGSSGDYTLDGFEHALLSLKQAGGSYETESPERIEQRIEEDVRNPYGLCIVAYDRASLEKFPAAAGLEKDVFSLSSGNVENVVLLAPEPDCDLSAFREIVYLERPAAVLPRTGNARVWVNGERDGCGELRRSAATREELLEIFAALRGNADKVQGDSYAEAARNCGGLGFPPARFVFALAVFEELGLIELSEGRLKVFRGKKTELKNSTVFTGACRYSEEK